MLSYKFHKGLHKIKRIVTRPDLAKIKRVNFAITYRCNSQCKACSIWKIYRNKSEQVDQELDLNEIEGFFNSKYFEGLDEINLTGGEPFLRRDFRDLYQYLRRRFPMTSIVITTNGLKVQNGWVESVKDIYWTILIFSLDGLQEINDSIRGIKGSYQQVIKAINYYKKLYPPLRMGLSFTILPENYHELRDVYNISRKLNLSFTMRFACESETYYGNTGMKKRWTDEMLSQVERDVKSIVTEMANSRSFFYRLLNPDLYFFSRMVHYQREKRRIFRCYSGTHSLFLDPYGNVFPCIFSETSLGNINKESFDDLWFSTKAIQQRLYIDRGKCHCWNECETIPSLQRNLNHLKHL